MLGVSALISLKLMVPIFFFFFFSFFTTQKQPRNKHKSSFTHSFLGINIGGSGGSGDDDLVAGLSGVSVFCEESLFLNGLAVHQIWFQVVVYFC